MGTENPTPTEMSPEERLAAARVRLDKFTLEDWQAHSDLLRERERQLQVWTPTHDDWHSPAQWAGLLTERVAIIAAAEDYIGPLALIHESRRDAARDAAIQLGALAWAIIATCHRGEQYRATQTKPEGPDPNVLTLYLVGFTMRDGSLLGAYDIVARKPDDARSYAMRHIAPTLPQFPDIAGTFVAEGSTQVHGAHPSLPQPPDQTTSRLLEAARLAGLDLPTE